MGDVLIKAPVAIAFQRPREFQGDPNDVEKAVIRARWEGTLDPDFWEMEHVCPLCHLKLDAYTFAAHAPDCIKRNAPRGKLFVAGFSPPEKEST